MIKQLDHPPYGIDPEKHRRFDERQTVFMRRLWDKTASYYGHEYRENVTDIIEEDRPGYSRVDYARILAAWTVHDCFGGAFSWKRLGRADPGTMRLGQHPVSDAAVMSQQIKETARLFGADVIGICKLDRRWVYSHDRSGDAVDIPSEYEHAIVIGIAMDKEAVGSTPAYLSAAATGIGYSRMAFTIACLAQFIRNLRYKAIPMGNDTALSIPLAIDAGLGELGRNGLLITPEYGSCMRICKVFTDLPLEPDKPIELGVAEFCKQCNQCVDACKAEAINSAREPSFAVACPSNNKGILRWAVNADRCYEFWIENSACCSNCIAVCPFTHRDDTTR